MALLNNAVIRRDLVQSGSWGKVSSVSGTYTCTTSEAGLDNIAVAKVPANAKILGFSFNMTDAGLAVWDIGLMGVKDNTDVNATALATNAADATPVTTFFAAPVATGTDEGGYYIILTPDVAPTVAGVGTVTVYYEYEGYDA